MELLAVALYYCAVTNDASFRWKDNVEELYHVTPIPYPEDYYSYIYEAMQGLTGDPGVPLEVLLNATDEVDIAQAEGALQVEVGNGVSAPSWTESNSDATGAVVVFSLSLQGSKH